MNLSFDGYEDYQTELQLFLAKHWPEPQVKPTAGKIIAFRRAAIGAGYLGRGIPREYGGSGEPSDPVLSHWVTYEFNRVGAPLDPHGVGPMMLVPTLLARGEEWQKRKWIPDTVLGEVQWCQGYSEPGSGSDLASLQTRAELRDGKWRINGQKIWTSSAAEADFMFCLVRTEPEASKHKGISYLLLDMKQPGIEVRPIRQLNGGSQFNEVFFYDAETPDDWIVGSRGEGWQVSLLTLAFERNALGDAERVQHLFDRLLVLAKRSIYCGRPALESESVRQRLAEIEGYVLSHKYSGYRQQSARLKQEHSGILEMMNKLHSTDIGHSIARLGLDLLRGDGLLDPLGSDIAKLPETDIEWVNFYMSSLGIAIAGGAANIQRNVIAERGLGLPRDGSPRSPPIRTSGN